MRGVTDAYAFRIEIDADTCTLDGRSVKLDGLRHAQRKVRGNRQAMPLLVVAPDTSRARAFAVIWSVEARTEGPPKIALSLSGKDSERMAKRKNFTKTHTGGVSVGAGTPDPASRAAHLSNKKVTDGTPVDRPGFLRGPNGTLGGDHPR